MKYKVAGLEGALLDAAVAKVEGRHWSPDKSEPNSYHASVPFSTQWAHGGPIIERERISVSNPNGDPGWIGSIAYPTKPKRNGTPQWGHHWECGRTPLIAAMRAYTASVFGEEVELP